MTRDSTSRPSGSVPSQCRAEAPSSRSIPELTGLKGARKGANSPQIATSAIRVNPIFRLAVTIRPLASPSLRQPDDGIDEAVEQVGQKGHDHDADDDDHSDREHDRKIPRPDRGDQQPANPRHRDN